MKLRKPEPPEHKGLITDRKLAAEIIAGDPWDNSIARRGYVISPAATAFWEAHNPELKPDHSGRYTGPRRGPDPGYVEHIRSVRSRWLIENGCLGGEALEQAHLEVRREERWRTIDEEDSK